MKNAFRKGNILIPNIDRMDKWAVIACDQFTSQPEYWEKVKAETKGFPSSLNLILPEIYLNSSNVSDRIKNIHTSMDEYLNGNIFTEYKNSMIYVERKQTDGFIRSGIIGVIDLEEYDFNKGSTSQVRATESTVVERIPPRIKIRENAALELPHIMILIDDPQKKIIESLAELKNDFKKLYDFQLMQGGGSICGYLINEKTCKQIESDLEKLGDSENFRKKYGTDNVLVYAMGDGNHSLATAKQFYENLKKENPGADLSNHPARYALAEAVNLHSEALHFEAIHRIVTDVDADRFISEMTESLLLSDEFSDQKIICIRKGEEKTLYIHQKSSNLAVGSLQNFIDSYIDKNGGNVDYIHGVDVVKKLAQSENSIGFILEDMDKNDLFRTVIFDGSLPRKTFSMGHAEDKRYYIECRKIKDLSQLFNV